MDERVFEQRFSCRTAWAGFRALAVAVLVVGCSGCVAVDGGAVEARWVLRNTAGIAVRCGDETVRIAKVRFVLDPVEGGDDPCADTSDCLFPCDRGVGTTPFVIPSGSYGVQLQMIDADGQVLGDADGVRLPGLAVREVRRGQLTGLGVNLVIVER